MKNELSASQKALLQKLPKGTKLNARAELHQLFLKANKESKKKTAFIERLFESYDPSDFKTFKGYTHLHILNYVLNSKIPLTEILFNQLSHIHFPDKNRSIADSKRLLLSILLLGGFSPEKIREFYPILSHSLIERGYLEDLNLELCNYRNIIYSLLPYLLCSTTKDRALQLLRLLPDDLELWTQLMKTPDVPIETVKECLDAGDEQRLQQLIRENLPMIKLLSLAYPSLSIYTPYLSYDTDDLKESTIQALSKLYGICTSCELTEPIHTHRMGVIQNDVFLVNFSSFERLQVPPSSDPSPKVRRSLIQNKIKNLQFRFHSPQSAYEVINHPIRDKFKMFPLNLKRLSKQIEENPFMISFFQELFAAFGETAPIFHQLAPYFLKKRQFRISLSMNDCWKYGTFEKYLQDKWKIEGVLLDHLAELDINDADLIASCVPLIKQSDRVLLLQIFDSSIFDEELTQSCSRKQLQKEFLIKAMMKFSRVNDSYLGDCTELVTHYLQSKTPIPLKMTPWELRNALKDKDQIN